MSYKLKLMTAALAAILLSACDSIPFIDNSSDYKGAGRSKPLEVPPDLTRSEERRVGKEC